jgi:Galactose oxidase, central domain
MRFHPTKLVLRLGLSLTVLSFAAGFVACADALHLDPPGTTTSTSTVVNKDGGTGGGSTACTSNPDCTYPTPVCDAVKATCVQCLVLSDCAGIPGTVCSQGSCTCPTGSTCLSTVWAPTSTLDAPAARSHHVAVWTGSKMVVWGGQSTEASPLNTGGVYDPSANVWTPTSAPAALVGRYDATAVWDDTDGLMLVFGGAGASGTLSDGWRYDPAMDKWTPMAALNPAATDAGADDGGTTATFAGRADHSAVWATGLATGLTSKNVAMIVWGGVTDLTTGATAGDGAIYDPAGDKWTVIPAGMSGAPGARAFHAAAWSSNSVMLLLGGASSAGATATLADDSTYTLVPGNAWNTLTGTPPPSARMKHTGIWDPVTMAFLVWGGYDGNTMYFQDGAALSTSNTWTSFGGTGALPAGRVDHSSVVLAGSKGSQLVVFGGDNASGILGDGWSLDTSPGGAWSSLATPGPAARKNHTAVATTTPGSSTLGAKMIVWGGETAAGVYTNSGAIYTAQ